MPALAALALLAGCAGSGAGVADIRPGERPPMTSDEAGLWMQMQRAEDQLRASGALLRDAALHTYVREVVCRLAADYCRDVRVYVVRRAGFNASMAPNGMLVVWSGLLLRTANEAQLAYVLGHEMGHYLKRHSLQMWRERRSRRAGAAIVGTMLDVALGGTGTAAVQSAVAGSLAAFSRETEREADELGLEAMAKAGYAPAEAARVWEQLLKEEKTAAGTAPSAFFPTHPPTEERLGALRELAARTPAGDTPGKVGRDALLATTGRLRAMFLGDELQQRRFAATQVLLDHLLAAGERPAELQFFQGELYRLRNAADDGPRAIAAYRAALALPDPPAESHRSLGVLLLRVGDRVGARAAFAGYLERKPDGDDAAMIRAQLRELE